MLVLLVLSRQAPVAAAAPPRMPRHGHVESSAGAGYSRDPGGSSGARADVEGQDMHGETTDECLILSLQFILPPPDSDRAAPRYAASYPVAACSGC
jgi:hypothetical protein